MTGDQAGRILARLAEIEAEIAALYREMDGIDAALDEHEQSGR